MRKCEGLVPRKSRRNPEKQPDQEIEERPETPQQRPPQDEYGIDPVQIHEAYVERQLGGGGPATPEAYARAIEQWHALPGAVWAPATEQTGERVPRSPADREREHGELDDGSHDEPQG